VAVTASIEDAPPQVFTPPCPTTMLIGVPWTTAKVPVNTPPAPPAAIPAFPSPDWGDPPPPATKKYWIEGGGFRMIKSDMLKGPPPIVTPPPPMIIMYIS
jgi:hypothetical protein